MIIPSPFNGKEPQIHDDAFIAPNAVIIGDVEIGAGTNVWFGVVIRAAACTIKIGKKCSIQENVVIHSEPQTTLNIGNNVLIGHSAMVHGPGDIGDKSLIGIGAIKLQGKEVGKGCLVGAGSLVTKNVPDYSKVLGAPAAVKGTLTKSQVIELGAGTSLYAELGKKFKEKGLDQRALK
ncbi:MAG: gamma carbonic anhydrase family protein [Promethearchaeota archaeon]